MPKFNPDSQINIHDLTIEGPEQRAEMLFDPEKDLTEEDWEFMEKTARKFNNGDWSEDRDDYRRYIRQLIAMKILGRETQISKRGGNELSGDIRSNDLTNELLVYAAVCRILVEQKSITKSLKSLKDCAEYEDWESFSSVLFPLILIGKKLKITPNEINHIEEKLKQYIDMGGRAVETAFKFAAFLKLIKKDFVLPSYILEKFRETFLNLHKTAKTEKKPGRWFEFSEAASYLSIISADEIVIPEGGGLELVRHKKESLQSDMPALPEQKQF